jgi:hypothetical protein
MVKDTNICCAEDYAPDSHAEGYSVRLPSGKLFLLRYPRLAFRIGRLIVAQSVAAMLQRDAEPGGSESIVRSYYEVLCEVCMRPGVSLTPGKGELHPDRITLNDALFIVRWAGGEIDADGNDLSAFRANKPKADAPDSASSADVRTVAERPVGDVAVETAV